MLARYNNRLYYYVFDPERNMSHLITKKKEKASDGFVEHREGVYIKNILIEELTDAFDIDYSVIYRSGIEGLSDEWLVPDDDCDIDGEHIKISRMGGDLPGWIGEDKCICYKLLKPEEVESAKIMKTYIRKDGVTLAEPVTVVENVDGRTLVEAQVKHMRSNL